MFPGRAYTVLICCHLRRACSLRQKRTHALCRLSGCLIHHIVFFAPTVKVPHGAHSIFAAVSIKIVFKQFLSQQAIITEVDTYKNIWELVTRNWFSFHWRFTLPSASNHSEDYCERSTEMGIDTTSAFVWSVENLGRRK